MLPLFRPLFFARRVRRALLAVPGVEGVRVYREVTTRRVVEVTGNNPEGVADWEYQIAAAVEDAMDVVGGFVNHDLGIVPPGESIRWNAKKARLHKAEMELATAVYSAADALGGPARHDFEIGLPGRLAREMDAPEKPVGERRGG